MISFPRSLIAGLTACALGLTAAIVTPVATPAQAQGGRPDSFADLAERLSPSVVNISTSQNVAAPDTPAPPIPRGSPFEDLFRDFFDRNQRGPRQVSSLGSGFVITEDGFIVTNNHVIENADEIVVNFADGSSLPAELRGTDPKTDIALLKVEPEAPLPAVSFGSSERMRVGDWVIAIGNPFGLGGSVSAGIISARDRDINAGPYDDFIQTDAAINRGNSGGPLFNLEGDVIGVNTAIISPSGGSIGIGFAVPSDLAANVVNQLQEFGETRRGWLGVRIQTVTPEIADSLGLDAPRGALIADVTPDGPAEAGGIQPGDVVLSFDGDPVDQMRDLPRMVADTPVGETVAVEVWRRGAIETVSIDIGRLDEGETAAAAEPDGDDSAPNADAASIFGLTLEPLTAQRRADLDLPDDLDGVVITGVETDSDAARKQMRPGDVIVEVGQEPVTTPGQVIDRVEEARQSGRKSVLFLLHNEGELRFVALSLSEG
jgi:serine protease Do